MSPQSPYSLQSSVHSSYSLGSTSSRRKRKSAKKKNYTKSVTNLIDRLLSFLEKGCKQQEIHADHEDGGTTLHGLAIPAQAVSWLGSAFYELSLLESSGQLECEVEVEEGDENNDENSISSRFSLNSHTTIESFNIMGLTQLDMIQKYARRLKLLKDKYLPRATHVRITDHAWPKANARKELRMYDESVISKETDVVRGAISTFGCGIGHSQSLSKDGTGEYLEVYNEGFANGSSEESVASSIVPVTDSTWIPPRLDMSIFPNISVLVLESIPPEWLYNFSAVRKSLRLLRCEGGAIFSVPDFLFPVESDGNSNLKPVEPISYPNLTHLRLSRCAIGELSGLLIERKKIRRKSKDGKRRRKFMSPLSRLPMLTALNLSHNELLNVTTVLAGVKDLPLLTRIDLSYNRISSMKNANYMLGNIKTLFLSYNKVSCLRGIDRMLSLERLALDHNRLEELSDVALLAKLPCLNSVDLEGNPFTNSNISYRIEVLHLFQQERSSMGSADYLSLPSLDGKRVSDKELEILANLFFSKHQKNLPFEVMTSGAPSVSRSKKIVRSSPSRVALVSEVSLSIDFENSKDRSFCTIQPAFESNFTVCDVISTHLVKTKTQLNFRSRRMQRIRSLRSKRLSKDSRTTDATGDSTDEHITSDDGSHIGDVLLVESPVEQSRETPVVSDLEGFSDMMDNDPNRIAGIEKVALNEAKERQGVSDEENTIVDESDGKVKESSKGGYTLSETSKSSGKSTTRLSPQNNDDHLGKIIHGRRLHTDLKLAQKHSGEESNEVSLSDTSRLPAMNVMKLLDQIDSSEIDSSVSQSFDPGSIRNIDEQKYAGLSTLLEKIDEINEENENENETEQILDQIAKNSSQGVESSESNDVECENKLDPVKVLYDTKEEIEFDSVSSDNSENSFHSSDADNLTIEDTPCAFHDGHNFSNDQKYDGPVQYSNLQISLSVDNLKLYFKHQVFGVPEEETNKNEYWRPRILVLKSDKNVGHRERRRRSNEEQNETFVDLFREDIIGCGRALSVRIPEKITTPKTFAGEKDMNRVGLISETRKMILCMSDEAIYFIPDEYIDEIQKVEAQERRGLNRPFPSPIHIDDSFKNACWPHAIARHCFQHLSSVTLGFQFQRMTLRFLIPVSDESDMTQEFSYILLTRNKQKTMSLFRILQAYAREAKGELGHIADDGFVITNDDQTLLDAIADVTSPNHPGSILHYHILEQRWKDSAEISPIRRVFVISDLFIMLFDEFYKGDGSSIHELTDTTNEMKTIDNSNGSVRLQLVHIAPLTNVVEVVAANMDPRCIRIVVSSGKKIWNAKESWRLLCSSGNSAQDIVTNVRKAIRYESL